MNPPAHIPSAPTCRDCHRTLYKDELGICHDCAHWRDEMERQHRLNSELPQNGEAK